MQTIQLFRSSPSVDNIHTRHMIKSHLKVNDFVVVKLVVLFEYEKQLQWLPVKFIIYFKICTIIFRTLKDKLYTSLAYSCSRYIDLLIICIPHIKTKTGSRVFSIAGPTSWKDLTVSIRNVQKITFTFRESINYHLFKRWTSRIG